MVLFLGNPSKVVGIIGVRNHFPLLLTCLYSFAFSVTLNFLRYAVMGSQAVMGSAVMGSVPISAEMGTDPITAEMGTDPITEGQQTQTKHSTIFMVPWREV